MKRAFGEWWGGGQMRSGGGQMRSGGGQMRSGRRAWVRSGRRA